MNYEDEYAELIEWLKRRNEETSKIPASIGRDGEYTTAMHNDVLEWNRRLKALKEKYNIE